MKIKSIGANKTELEFKDLRLLVSYSTPVALIRYPGGAIKTEEFHSVTTSKHINQWIRESGLDPDKIPAMPQDWFNEFLEDNTQ